MTLDTKEVNFDDVSLFIIQIFQMNNIFCQFYVF